MLVLRFDVSSVESLLSCLNAFVSSAYFNSFSLGVSCSDEFLKEKLKSSSFEFLASLGKKSLDNDFEASFLVDANKGLVYCRTSPVFIFGRYNKFSRSVAQTFHFCFVCKGKGCEKCGWSGKMSEHSVQEILESVFLPAFKASSSKFHGCGREDVDVRMLGGGRPFVLELQEPLLRNIDLLPLLSESNKVFPSAVFFSSFRYSSRAEVVKIKNSIFEKIYSCVCVCDKKFSFERLFSLCGSSFEVFQRTPLRVSKRRPALTRNKKVSFLRACALSDVSFKLELRASHGLYVKEFVSGDNGRTIPSVSSLLGVPCFCKELDVLEILGVELS